MHILHQAGVLFFAAAHHQLINFALGHLVKIFCNGHRHLCDGKVIRQIHIRTVAGQPFFGGQAERTAQRRRVAQNGLHILPRDGILEEGALSIVAIGPVVGHEHVKLHPGELLQGHRHGRTAGGDAELDAVGLQPVQRFQHPGSDLLFLHIDQGAIDVKEDDPGLVHGRFLLFMNPTGGRRFRAPAQ